MNGLLLDRLSLDRSIEIAGWTLLHFLWQGGVIGLLLWGILSAIRSATPQSRYIASCAALLAMLAAPVGTAAWLLTSSAFSAAENPARSQSGFVSPAFVADASNDAPFAPPDTVSAPSMQTAPAAVPLVENGDAQVDHSMARRLPLWADRVLPWLPTLVGLWGAGVLFQLARLFLGWRVIRALKFEGTDVPPGGLRIRFDELRTRLGIRTEVRLLCVVSTAVPMVIGWWRPAVLVPTGLLTGLVPAQLDAILAHELMHVRRHDFLVNLLQNLVETLLFYHPAVWWVSKQIRAEREHCCDDGAAAICGGNVDYACALAALAEWRGARPALGLAATGGSLLARIRRLAGIAPPDRVGGAWPGLGLLLLLVGLIAVGVHNAAGVAIEDNSPESADTAEGAGTSSPAATGNETEQEKVSVTGRVLDSRGAPVGGALVWLAVKEAWDNWPEGPPVIAKGESTSDGRFELSPAKATVEQFVKSDYTRFQIWVRKPGLALAQHASRGRLPDQPVEIRLSDEPSVEFRLRNADSSPASGVLVTPAIAIYYGDSMMVIPEPISTLLRVRSDADGRYVVTGLETAQIRSLKFETTSGAPQSYYFSYRINQRIPTDHTLRKTGSLTGRLVLPIGARADLSKVRLRIATLELTGPGGELSWIGELSINPERDGSFHIPAIAAGKVVVRVHEPEDFGYLAVSLEEETFVRAGESTSLEIPMRKSVRITRRIQDASTKMPIAGVRVHMEQGTRSITARTGADGRFSAWILPDVNYHTLYDYPDEYTRRAMRMIEDTRAPADAAAFELPPVELLKGRTIEGTVVDAAGNPLPEIRVGADWKDQVENGTRYMAVGAAVHARAWGKTDSQGHFRIPGVHPEAEVTLTAERSGIVLAPSLHVAPTSTEPVRLRTTKFDFTSLQGRVIDRSGKPIAGAEVMLQYEQLGREFHATWWLVTDADGRFETQPHFPRQYNYRIMVRSKNRDGETSPWMSPAESGNRFPDFSVDPSRLTLPDLLPEIDGDDSGVKG